MRFREGRSRSRTTAGVAALTLATLLLASGAPADAGPRRASPPVGLSSSSPAFSYLGAWGADWLGVRIAPNGTATFRVRKTGWLKMTVWATGGSFKVSTDGGAPTAPTAVPDCGCFKTLSLADGLTSTLHQVTVTNADATRSFAVRTWLAAAGGQFLQYYWAHPELAHVVQQGSSYSFTVRTTSSISVGYLANGVQVRVGINDRYLAFTFTGPSGGGIAHQVIAWGLTPGFEKITLTALKGNLDLRMVSLLQAGGAGTPSVVGGSTLASTPVLGIYGDSIVSGMKTLGRVRDSDGFADRLGAIRGWRVTHRGLGGASAGCWGKSDAALNRILNSHPDIVIVAFGTNDMIPGSDYYGCDDDLDQFKAGMDVILSRIATGMPGVPVLVGAIIPTPKVDESTRATWNAALTDIASQHGDPVIDASSVLSSTEDYADAIHPNNRGHEDMAQYWNSAITSLGIH